VNDLTDTVKEVVRHLKIQEEHNAGADSGCCKCEIVAQLEDALRAGDGKKKSSLRSARRRTK
jgi:hypothetical protein